MPENLLDKFKSKISHQWKVAFYSTVVIGLLVHLFIFTNRLMNHDSLHNIYNTQAKVKSGRFFLGPASGMSTFFDLPWVIGLISIFFLALTVICIVQLFNIRKTLSIILVAGIVVAFPSVTSTFSYMFTADGYMVGQFIAVLAVIIAKRSKYGFIWAAFLVCLSIGVYQANLSVVLAFMILFLLIEILCFNLQTKSLLDYILKFGLMIVIGLGMYYVSFKTYTVLFSGYITNYQGLDSVGSLPLSSIPTRILQIKEQVIDFFFRGFFSFHGVNLFEVLNVLLFIIIFIVTARIIIKRGIYKNLVQMIAIFVLVFSLPFAYYIVYFLSPDTFYHMLMVFSMTSVYLYLILIYDKIEPTSTSRFDKITSWISVILLSVTIFNFGLIANITYFNMELRYEKSMALVNRVLDRIEHLEGYEDIEDLAVIGRVSMYSEMAAQTIPNSIPNMIGGIGETFLVEPYHYKAMLETFYGFPIELTTDENLEAIKDSSEFKEMDVWPAETSIQKINDTVVIKFEDM